MEKKLWVDCECCEYEHAIRFSRFDIKRNTFDEDDHYVYVDMMIENYKGFWKRLKEVWRYLFRNNQFGVSYQTMIGFYDANKIIDFLTEYCKEFNNIRRKKNVRKQ